MPKLSKFNDRNGDEWEVTLTVASLRRVTAQTKFPLLSLLDKKMEGLAKLYDDPETLVQILFAICEPEIEARGMEPEAFGECFSGDSILEAVKALIEAVADFYPDPKQRKILSTMHSKIETGVTHHLSRVETMVDEVTDEQIMEAIDRELEAAKPTMT